MKGWRFEHIDGAIYATQDDGPSLYFEDDHAAYEFGQALMFAACAEDVLDQVDRLLEG